MNVSEHNAVIWRKKSKNITKKLGNEKTHNFQGDQRDS